MDRNKETFETWNKIAAIYEDKFMNISLYDDTYNYICESVIQPGAKLLEIGCGPGNITRYLLTKRPDFDIYGIDISPNMIELAKKNNPTAHFDVMDCRYIGELTDSYDAIICGFCLPYLSDDEGNQLIANAYNLLNENGLIYISFVEGEADASGFKVGGGGRVYFYYHNLEILKENLIKTKFSDLKTFKVAYKTSETTSDTHTILTAKKKGK